MISEHASKPHASETASLSSFAPSIKGKVSSRAGSRHITLIESYNHVPILAIGKSPAVSVSQRVM